MSKKKFAAGLESLFDDALEEGLQDSSPLLHHGKKGRKVSQEKEPVSVQAKAKAAVKGRKRSASKNFTSDLDSLFEDALKESVLEKVEKIKEKTLGNEAQTTRQKRRSTVALSGIDALIRKTSDTGPLDVGPAKKRVTFVFDRKKFQRLKNIAKEERAYLKDIIGDVVSKFISEYERNNGGKAANPE